MRISSKKRVATFIRTIISQFIGDTEFSSSCLAHVKVKDFYSGIETEKSLTCRREGGGFDCACVNREKRTKNKSVYMWIKETSPDLTL